MSEVVLGLRPNLRAFLWLVLINGLVGAMVGLERSIMPALAQREFHLAGNAVILSFITVFGVTKAATNYLAGRLSDRVGRRPVLLAGWVLALPVPVLLAFASSWNWVLAANALLGVSQGLTWSTTVVMKIDLVGPKRRGLAMGINEFAGYVAVGLSALATAAIAERWGLRPAPFYLGIAVAVLGLGLSWRFAIETKGHVQLEAQTQPQNRLTQPQIFRRMTWQNPTLSAVTLTGLVNNLNDGMAWGLFPLLFVRAGLDLPTMGVLAALYPMVWGVAQLGTGAWSDRIGRKPLIVSGMLLQAAGLVGTALGAQFGEFAASAVALGLGTAMVYPVLLAAIGDVAAPDWRASAVGVYRLWRDLGYALGALIAGVVADQFGVRAAVLAVAALTAAAGVWAGMRMRPVR